MNLEVKYIFPTSTPDVNNYIYKLPEGLGMRRILAHDTRIEKNPRIRKGIFRIFTDFYRVCQSKVQHTAPDRNFINGIDALRVSYCLLLSLCKEKKRLNELQI